MFEISYMRSRLDFTNYIIEQLKREDLNMTLVHRLIDKNGWSFPYRDEISPDCGYMMAVNEVEWFLNQLIELSK